MNKQLKYVPIFRGRQQELVVLKSFDFTNRIYPCLEIIKEVDRVAPKPRKNSKKSVSPAKEKLFEDVYIPLIKSIKAEKVFIDLPVHLNGVGSMKPETLQFLRSVVSKRDERTKYIKKLASLSSKVIPVISTYYNINSERGSITLQEKDLRTDFSILAFRTFQNSFSNDILQIKAVLKSHDYVIMDWEDSTLNKDDPDQLDIIDELKTLNCTVIIHRNSIPKQITNVGLDHGKKVSTIDNSILDIYHEFGGTSFSDYSGVKKDEVSKGGTVSPGFLYYDSVHNAFYGFKGKVKDLEEFKVTIVPDVISSQASSRMKKGNLSYLGPDNIGWDIINRIHQNLESGKSAAKFKRISLEHYLHCLKLRIINGDFD